LLSAAGFDVLLFDYRGYGASTGTPSEQDTYRDARVALRWLLEQPEVDPRRVVYLGESLGGAIALELALFSPPAGTTTSSPALAAFAHASASIDQKRPSTAIRRVVALQSDGIRDRLPQRCF
jgi:pimeloyl-ACP methyl ester carboxylesterase